MAAISSSISSQSVLSCDTKVVLNGSIRHLESATVVNNASTRRLMARPLRALEPAKRHELVIAAAAAPPSVAESYGAALVEDEVVDYEKLAAQLENASPLEITDKALQMFGNEIAIAFSCS